MDGVKKNFGFGCMRLPMIGEDVDIAQINKMVDTYLEQIRKKSPSRIFLPA